MLHAWSIGLARHFRWAVALSAGLVLTVVAPIVTPADAAGVAGDSWSIVTSANSSPSQFNSLSQVSCVTAADCWAVGSVASGSFDSTTLAEHWNGSSWSIASTPNPSASTLNAFNGVFCLSSMDCWATGLGSGTGSADETLAEHWNGSTWSIVPTPSPSSVSILGGVDCSSSTDCWTVGHEAGQTLAEHWNGAAWTVVATADTSPTEDNELGNVTCASTADCWAVGDADVGGVEQTLAERWNGSAWSIISTPDSSPSQQNGLAGVACVASSDCWAVGFQDTGTVGAEQTLTELWNGTNWSIVTSGKVPTTQTNYLEDVSCLGSSDCWAVGAADNSTLAEHWDGSVWTVVATPATSYRADFGGVSCPSVSTCWAVGLAANGSGGTVQTLTERWSSYGYWAVASDGGIFNFGEAGFFGSMGGRTLNAPVVSMASTRDGGGYWEVASDGGIFNFGDAPYDGSMGGKQLNAPIVALAATPDGDGYWEVASDGGIFNFGDDAAFAGSMGGQPLNKPIVGIAATPDGGGYWEVASDGGIFAFGDAVFQGSMGGKHLNAPIVAMAATPDGGGYWEVASDGGIFAFGDAGFQGSMGGQHLNEPIVGMTSTADGGGYWEVASDGGVFSFGDAVFEGSMGGQVLNKPIVGMAGAS